MLDGLSGLRQWVVAFVSVAMFATFVELLLPESSLAKHVKMVLGFVVVLFLVKPLVTLDVEKMLEGAATSPLGRLLTSEASWTIPEDTQKVIQAGDSLAQETALLASSRASEERFAHLESSLSEFGKGKASVSSEGGRVTVRFDADVDKVEVRRRVARLLGVDESAVVVTVARGH